MKVKSKYVNTDHHNMINVHSSGKMKTTVDFNYLYMNTVMNIFDFIEREKEIEFEGQEVLMD